MEKVCIYDRVEISKKRVGVVAFVGFTYFALEPMYGIILDKPLGKNNGTVKNRQYFVCNKNHGIFVPRCKIIKIIKQKYKKFHNRIAICDNVMTELYGLGNVKFVGMLYTNNNNPSSTKPNIIEKYGGIWYGISLTTPLNAKQIKLIQQRFSKSKSPKKRMSATSTASNVGIVKQNSLSNIHQNTTPRHHHHVVNHSVTGIAINHHQTLSSVKFPISSTSHSSSSSSSSTASSMISRVRPRSNDYYSWQSFDGKYDGTAYFYCRKYQGLFARQQQLILMEEQKTPRYVSPKPISSSTKVCGWFYINKI